MTPRPATASLGRRLLCLIYETLLLIAVLLLAGGITTVLAQAAAIANPRTLTRIIVSVVCAGYFTTQWLRSGQTLPMKTWRIRLETASGTRITLPQALLRLALATIGYAAMGISVLWALADRDRQFLHDRLAGTRLVAVTKPV